MLTIIRLARSMARMLAGIGERWRAHRAVQETSFVVGTRRPDGRITTHRVAR